jgi:hypothetical protein
LAGSFSICFVESIEGRIKEGSLYLLSSPKMFDDQDLGFFANFLGIFIFIMVIAYHFVVAEPKFE